MIVGVGTDIVEHKRIEKIYNNFGKKFYERYFSLDEIEYSLSKIDPVPYLAARFAVKEALIKSLSIKHRIGLYYKNIEVRGKNFGKKQVHVSGKIAEMIQEKQVQKIHFSISHSENYSIALVILES